MQRANTIGVIAERAGCPVHRVEYLVRARGIKAAYMAGNAKVFDDAAVSRLLKELSTRRANYDRCRRACETAELFASAYPGAGR